MNVPEAKEITMPSEEGYDLLLRLQKGINEELHKIFDEVKEGDRDKIAESLVNAIEALVKELEIYGYSFGRCDYSGDINYENSEQTYSGGEEMGKGIILHFHGFSAQVSWENA